MFRINWNRKKNTVLLKSSTDEKEDIVPPRIVFSDELRVLGIDKYSYTKESLPVCWCIDRRYYYKGEIIFEVKGGDLYHDPTIIYPKDFLFRKLEPIDIQYLYDSNIQALEILQNEAMDFIEEQYKHYSPNIDTVAVAFSGDRKSVV